MKVLSLFDGISCWRIALERAWIQVDSYYASEIDKYAIQVSQKNYPDIIHIGSVTDIRYWDLWFIGSKWNTLSWMWGSIDVDIDLLIGGSPCQDLSIAKKWWLWLQWEKSNLFYEYIRILNEVKPKYFLLENVNSMKKSDRDEITRIIGVEPIMINSALVSAQNRKRLYWTNIPWIQQPNDKWIILKSILESVVDKKYIISEKHTNAMIQSRNCKKLNIADPETKSSCITASYFKIPNDAPYVQTIRVWHFNSGGQWDRVYSPEWKSVALSANGWGRWAKTWLYEVPPVVRKLTPLECERLQTLPENYTDCVSNSQRYKAIGNWWTVDVIAHIFSHIK